MTDTQGKVIKCKAAVCWKIGDPLSMEEVEVEPPKKGEIRIKVIANGVCHTDLSAKNGIFAICVYPVVLGHEAGGVVESVGEGVTSVGVGDHVIPAFLPQCRNCRGCKSPKGNICDAMGMQNKGCMPDGTPRFTCKGVKLHHFLGVSSFSEYTVVSEFSICKIGKDAPLDKVCLLGCGVGTGYGAAVNTAEVFPGSSCAVWGLGGIGLSAVMGCRNAGAKRIIGVDINPAKFEVAKVFGVTEFLNPMDHDRPTSEVLRELTDGGLDYTFECIGRMKTIEDAFYSTFPSSGTSVIVGCPPPTQTISFNPTDMLWGRTWKSSLYGGWKTRDSIPCLVEQYLNKKIQLDELVSSTRPLEEVNEAFKDMEAGTVIRTVLNIGSLS